MAPSQLGWGLRYNASPGNDGLRQPVGHRLVPGDEAVDGQVGGQVAQQDDAARRSAAMHEPQPADGLLDLTLAGLLDQSLYPGVGMDPNLDRPHAVVTRPVPTGLPHVVAGLLLDFVPLAGLG